MGEKWYFQSGPEGDVVISSRIRLARNVGDLPFPDLMSARQRAAFIQRVQAAVENAAFGEGLQLRYVDVGALDQSHRMALVERHLISLEMAKAGGGLLLSDDETVSVMLCEEDHLRIQIMGAGLCCEGCWQLADRLDDLLDEGLHFAFDERWGYLTHCPTNLGTGMRASVMVHLPALERSGYLRSLINSAYKLGITIRGTYGEGTSAEGSFYQISNQLSLGLSEKQVRDNLAAVVRQLAAEERRQRAQFCAEDPLAFEDRVYRALGVLENARLLSHREVIDCVSQLRLGIAGQVVEKLDFFTAARLLGETGANSIAAAHPEAQSARERDRIRAQIVRDILGRERRAREDRPPAEGRENQ
ncbi:ATP--guanido phosphotransferase [Bittarella massiliensis (ex Durand et al. 2017)]|uniref:ATP--guanido phosphotransferase n=1 Tax=Bittarella massiliensis (ex Durand et al. 2017) TaxID=1720313 RepID=A0AAW5KIE3_9FIRM|nr:ATP--guanido phosphotransferase [Bittarella massiliensis (ex Durand et al. 2017)]MCQ4950469.1 ATP--guanido phosphotransferase [Bittarella massiliensis (ex Durand et al. 2017)]